MKKLFFVFTSALLVLSACSSGQDSKVLFEEKCIQCHSLEKALSATKSLPEWKRTVEAMVRYADGAISNSDAEKIAKYLAERPKD